MRFADAPKSKSGPAAESEPLKASPAVAWKWPMIAPLAASIARIASVVSATGAL
jgi:hypothetical protein